jgi:peroxiredoxin
MFKSKLETIKIILIKKNFFLLLLKTHLPGYVANYENIKAKGYDVIACVSVNDVIISI